MKSTSLIAVLALLLPVSPIAHAEASAEKEARMKWFNEARFGMFIHWGVYSGAAGNFKGKPVPGAGEWLQSGGVISIENLITRPAKVSLLGHDGTLEILGSEGAWKIHLPEGSVQKIATVLALDFPVKPEIQAGEANP